MSDRPPLLQTLIDDPRQGARALLLALFGAALIATAWLGDDGLISLRMVANALSGHGLVWNPGERVQAFTHPLWVLLLLPVTAVTRELHYTTIALSMLLSGAAVAVLALRVAGSALGGAMAVLAVLASKAFVDYSTSGLENPLTHLLLALALAVFLAEPRSERKVARLSVLLGLAITTRHDNLWLFAPLMFAELLAVRTRGALARSLLGLVPFGLWTLFSIWYYGFPFPNTAYAKLGTGIPLGEKLAQGLYYLGWSAVHDPATVLVLVAGPTLTLLRRDRAAWPLLLGLGLHLSYVVSIGGDFMGGRFLSGATLVGAALLGRACGELSTRTYGVAAALGLLGLYPVIAGPSTEEISSKSGKGPVNWHGIADERGYYYERLGLLVEKHPSFARAPLGTAPRWKDQPIRAVEVDVSIGMSGLFAKPGTWYLDPVALADPLLARLPMLDRGGWRPGHYLRMIPEGYPETLRTGEVALTDPQLAELYTRLAVITRGDLLSLERLGEILKFNLGSYKDLIDRERYAHPAVLTFAPAELTDRAGEDPHLGRFSALGARVALPEKTRARALTLGLSARHGYVIKFMLGEDRLGEGVQAGEPDKDDMGVALRRVVVPEKARGGFDRIEIRPVLEGSDQQFRITFFAIDASEGAEDLELEEGAEAAEARPERAERGKETPDERAARRKAEREAERKAREEERRRKRREEKERAEDG